MRTVRQRRKYKDPATCKKIGREKINGFDLVIYGYLKMQNKDNVTKIIAITNPQGCIGKTATAVNLSIALAQKGKSVLVVDSDPAGRIALNFGITIQNLRGTLNDVYHVNQKVEDCIVQGTFPNVDVLPSDISLAEAEIMLSKQEGREYLLKEHLNRIKDKYDYIMIDCPSSLSLLTVNAMVASDSILIPMQCDEFALERINKHIQIICQLNEKLGTSVLFGGILLTMFEEDKSIWFVNQIRSELKQKCFNTVIPRDRKLAESLYEGIPLVNYDSNCPSFMAFENLADEL